MADPTSPSSPDPCTTANDGSGKDNLHPLLLRTSPEDGCATTDLERLCCLLEIKALEAIRWYLRRKEAPKFWSRLLRGLAILTGILGGLMPVIQGSVVESLLAPMLGSPAELGYVLLALSGAFILTDKSFGFSTNWVRFITTQHKLQTLLDKFQLDWVILRHRLAEAPEQRSMGQEGQTVKRDVEQQMLERLKEFRMETLAEIDKEMQTWVAEFQSNLALLEKSIKDRTEAPPKPGQKG